jgi:hypothetical protein
MIATAAIGLIPGFGELALGARLVYMDSLVLEEISSLVICMISIPLVEMLVAGLLY